MLKRKKHTATIWREITFKHREPVVWDMLHLALLYFLPAQTSSRSFYLLTRDIARDQCG